LHIRGMLADRDEAPGVPFDVGVVDYEALLLHAPVRLEKRDAAIKSGLVVVVALLVYEVAACLLHPLGDPGMQLKESRAVRSETPRAPDRVLAGLSVHPEECAACGLKAFAGRTAFASLEQAAQPGVFLLRLGGAAFEQARIFRQLAAEIGISTE